MDPQHRDRIAFMRLCSGTFKRGMKLTPTGHGKPIAVHSPILFFAQNREVADEAFPGDIIGIPNHGTLRVGDTLSERADVRFTGLPNFAPEILRRVALKDPTKTKQLRKALDDMAEEGVTQVFIPRSGRTGSSASSGSSSSTCCCRGWMRNIRSRPGWSLRHSTPHGGSRRTIPPT